MEVGRLVVDRVARMEEEVVLTELGLVLEEGVIVERVVEADKEDNKQDLQGNDEDRWRIGGYGMLIRRW